MAKIASDLQKPDGLSFIGPSKVEGFMAALPVEKFFGVGKVTAARMKAMGLNTRADLKRLTEEELVKQFGKAGHFYYSILRGVDNRAVEPNRETKSIGAEDTFAEDLITIDAMSEELEKIAVTVEERLKRKALKGRTITLKIKYHDFTLITRSQSVMVPVNDAKTMAVIAKTLLSEAVPEGSRVRLLGITLSNFGERGEIRPDIHQQLPLFQQISHEYPESDC